MKSNHFPLSLPAYNIFDHFNFCLPNVSVGSGEKSHCLSCIFTEEHLSMLIRHLFFINEETEVSKFIQYHTTHKWQKSDSRVKLKSTHSSASSISASLSTLRGVAFKTFHNLTLSVHNIPFLSFLSLQLTSSYCNWFLNTSCPVRLCYFACFLLSIFHLVNFHSSFKPWIKPFHFRIVAWLYWISCMSTLSICRIPVHITFYCNFLLLICLVPWTTHSLLTLFPLSSTSVSLCLALHRAQSGYFINDCWMDIKDKNL